MFCTKCGSQVKDGNIFCPVCGASMKATEETNNSNMGQAGGVNRFQKPKGRVRLVTKLVFVCETIAVVLLAAAVIIFTPKKSEPAINSTDPNEISKMAVSVMNKNKPSDKYADSNEVVKENFQALKNGDYEAWKNTVSGVAYYNLYGKSLDEIREENRSTLNDRKLTYSTYKINSVKEYTRDNNVKVREYYIYYEYYTTYYLYKNIDKYKLVYLDREGWKFEPGNQVFEESRELK